MFQYLFFIIIIILLISINICLLSYNNRSNKYGGIPTGYNPLNKNYNSSLDNYSLQVGNTPSNKLSAEKVQSLSKFITKLPREIFFNNALYKLAKYDQILDESDRAKVDKFIYELINYNDFSLSEILLSILAFIAKIIFQSISPFVCGIIWDKLTL